MGAPAIRTAVPFSHRRRNRIGTGPGLDVIIPQSCLPVRAVLFAGKNGIPADIRHASQAAPVS
jgi:hypothetical protein